MAFMRLGLIAILVYVGAYKLLTYHGSEVIRPYVEHSPLLSWMYDVWSGRVVAGILGAVEIVSAALIGCRPWSPFFALVGSLVACAIFGTTLSLLLTTPGAWETIEGFPLAIPAGTASFLLKDVVLLGAAAASAGEARRAMSLA